jgi:hypothetical protein
VSTGCKREYEECLLEGLSGTKFAVMPGSDGEKRRVVASSRAFLPFSTEKCHRGNVQQRYGLKTINDIGVCGAIDPY